MSKTTARTPIAATPAPAARLEAPAADPTSRLLYILGPLILGLSIALELMMAGFMIIGPAMDLQDKVGELTRRGQQVVRPERDLPVYLGGILLGLSLVVLLNRYWRHRVGRALPIDVPRYARYSAAIQAVIGLGSLALQMIVISSRYEINGSTGIREGIGSAPKLALLLAPLTAAVCAMIDLRWGFRGSGPGRPNLLNRCGDIASKALLVLVPVFVALTIFVPPVKWAYLAGDFFLKDGVHHWNYFGIGPVMAYMHGGAFSTDFYSQYGMGWPLTFVAIKSLLPPSYANMVGVGIIFGCIYYIALFFFLRLLLKESIWAATGVLLAIIWQMFSGIPTTMVMWCFPSSTMMRHPMDIAFFIALLMHLRRGKPYWLAAAGAAVGIGIFYETDTGIYLAATFLLYWLLTLGLPQLAAHARGIRGMLRYAGWFAPAVALPLLAGMIVASRGTVFSGAFWKGWMECLQASAGSGASLLPIAINDDIGLLLFLTVAGTYLAVMTWAVLRSLRRNGSEQAIMLGCISAYGMATLLLFVGRSHVYNLYHPLVPFAVVVTALLTHLRKAFGGYLQRTSIPYAMALGLVFLLVCKPTFPIYPGLLNKFSFKPPRDRGMTLMADRSDLKGIPDDEPGNNRRFVEDFKAISAAIRRHTADGSSVAILASDDTALHYASGTAPFFRHSALFHMIYTKTILEQVATELMARHPRYVVINSLAAQVPPIFDDIWKVLHPLVQSKYTFVETVGPYEIWRYPG